MKLLSYVMKLLHLITLSSQQFCLCGTLFNVHDTLIKYALRLTLGAQGTIGLTTCTNLSYSD